MSHADKLEKQSEYFNEVFSGIREMIDVLHTSIDNINSMGQAHDQQSEVIRNTVEINEHIAESIRQENAEFCNINEMVETNSKDIVEMNEQVAALNQMFWEIVCMEIELCCRKSFASARRIWITSSMQVMPKVSRYSVWRYPVLI